MSPNADYTKEADWVGPSRASRYMGISRSTLHRWERDGWIRVKRNDKGHRIYPVARLNEIKEHCRKLALQNVVTAAVKRKNPWEERRRRYGPTGCSEGKNIFNRVTGHADHAPVFEELIDGIVNHE